MKLGICVRRLNLFLKGNLDLRDTLHTLRLNGTVCWNGLNEVLRARNPAVSCRIAHETWTRSDALLAATGQTPAGLLERSLPLGSYPVASQFSVALFEARPDAFVLSIQPDVMGFMLRHRDEGYLLHAVDFERWPKDELAWLRAAFELLPRLEVAASMANLERIVTRCRAGSDAPILIYNLSPVVPGEAIHCHAALEDILATRIRRFNLGLIELSQRTGISIIDVETIVARHGADRLKIDALHLNAEGCRLVAEEVARVLDDLGCFGERPEAAA